MDVLGGEKKTFELRVQLNQALVIEPRGERSPLWVSVGIGISRKGLREQGAYLVKPLTIYSLKTKTTDHLNP